MHGDSYHAGRCMNELQLVSRVSQQSACVVCTAMYMGLNIPSAATAVDATPWYQQLAAIHA